MDHHSEAARVVHGVLSDDTQGPSSDAEDSAASSPCEFRDFTDPKPRRPASQTARPSNKNRARAARRTRLKNRYPPSTDHEHDMEELERILVDDVVASRRGERSHSAPPSPPNSLRWSSWIHYAMAAVVILALGSVALVYVDRQRSQPTPSSAQNPQTKDPVANTTTDETATMEEKAGHVEESRPASTPPPIAYPDTLQQARLSADDDYADSGHSGTRVSQDRQHLGPHDKLDEHSPSEITSQSDNHISKQEPSADSDATADEPPVKPLSAEPPAPQPAGDDDYIEHLHRLHQHYREGNL